MIRFTFAVLVFIMGCTSGEKSKPIERQQILEAAEIHGLSIANQSQQVLSFNLKKAIQEGGPSHAVKFCKVAAEIILDTLHAEIPSRIKRATLRARNPNDKPTSVERQILERYQAQLVNGEQLKPRIELLSDEEVLFAKPIVLDNPLCLNCHGRKGIEVSDETQKLINSLYPYDSAINHHLGDLRGIWSITFNQDALRKYLKNSK